MPPTMPLDDARVSQGLGACCLLPAACCLLPGAARRLASGCIKACPRCTAPPRPGVLAADTGTRARPALTRPWQVKEARNKLESIEAQLELSIRNLVVGGPN